MSQTPEGKVKSAVKKMLTHSQRWGMVYQFWPVQTGYGAATLDCLAGYQGRFFAIETKAPGKKPTPRQLLTIDTIRAAGCPTFTIDGSNLEELEAWLESVRNGLP